jgi:hypothetical protein
VFRIGEVLFHVWYDVIMAGMDIGSAALKPASWTSILPRQCAKSDAVRRYRCACVSRLHEQHGRVFYRVAYMGCLEIVYIPGEYRYAEKAHMCLRNDVMSMHALRNVCVLLYNLRANKVLIS